MDHCQKGDRCHFQGRAGPQMYPQCPFYCLCRARPPPHQPSRLIFALKAHCSRSPLAGLFQCHMKMGRLRAGRRVLVLKTELSRGPPAPHWTQLPSRNQFCLICSQHGQEICTKCLCGRRGRRWRGSLGGTGAPASGAQYDETGSCGKSVTSHLPWDRASAIVAGDGASETPTE